MNSKIFKGSSWARWDLHIHTPCSLNQEYGGDQPEVWEKFLQDLESLPPEFKVIGINDYLFLDGYQKIIEFRQQGRLSNLDKIFPVIELRTRALGGVNFNKTSRINLHVIFSDELLPEEIQRLFLNQIKWSKHLAPNTQSDYVGLSRAEVTRFGKEIREISPNTVGGDLEIGFKNLNIEDEDIYDLLKNRQLQHHCFTAIGVAEWGDFRWTASAAEKKHIPNRATFLFTGSPTVEKYKTGRASLKADQINELVLHCSDAHCFSENPHPQELRKIGHCFTWIKGEPIFESLRQLQFESTGRLLVSDSEPAAPLRTVDRIILTFPDQTLIARKNKTAEERNVFCLAGDRTFNFSPYFTCLVGGRGSGKSTILNLLAEATGNSTDFFEKNKIWCDGDRLDPKDFVKVEGFQEIDFIAQSQVEELADSPQLTEKIYDRLVQFAGRGAGFEQYKIDFHMMDEGFEAQIGRLKTQSEKQKQLIEKKGKLENCQHIIESRQNPEFQRLNESVSEIETQIQLLLGAKSRYELFRKKVSEVIDTFDTPENNLQTNPYDLFVSNAIETFVGILNQPFDEAFINIKLDQLGNQKDDLRKQLDKFLQSQNLSKENINDFENAVLAVPRLSAEIETLERELIILDAQIKAFENQIPNHRDQKIKFEKAISQALSPLNERLKQTNSHVAEIRFEYKFDEVKAREILFEDFQNEYKEFRDLRTVGDTLQSLLFLLSPSDSPSFTWQKIRQILDQQNRSTNALEILRRIFDQELHFNIYKLFMLRRFLNPLEFKKINVYYGNKSLDSCSFGQRCTAVLVTLMSFGNKPLVVDEPEAHLDSRLIADYLVELVKHNKLQRQIIFATHNANFVINGDAELIHILKIEEDLKTQCVSTSIENTENRPRLLELEGGVEAFQKREKKLLEGRK